MEMTPFWFGLYKLAKYVIYPYTWLIALIGTLTLLLFFPQASKRLGWIRLTALLALFVAGGLGSPLVATQLIGPLEERYPPFDANVPQRFDAIVVLGGGVQERGSLRPAHVIGEISLVRTLCGVDLFEHGLADRLVMSAGDASILRPGPEESVEMKRFAIRMGISPEAILTETRSRTTHENAVEIKRLLNDQSLLLVTSTSHMPRAMAHFQAQGLHVTAAPCGYVLTDRSDHFWRDNPFDLIPRTDALMMSGTAISEYVGLWVYRILGKL
jgi:uncharacterized SAM-binding protein YcdF (DUF218 family)